MKNHIKELRHQKGFTQKQLGDACGLNIRYIQKLEYGEHDIAKIQLSILLKLSKALSVSLLDLFEEEGGESSETDK